MTNTNRAANVLAFPTASAQRYAFTVLVAERIRRTGYRFDASWRQADDDGPEAYKARFYERCSTVAANDIADDPQMAAHWIGYL